MSDWTANKTELPEQNVLSPATAGSAAGTRSSSSSSSSSDAAPAFPASSQGGNHKKVAGILFGVAFAMLGAAYAAVPLYKIFCQVTGYGGTTQRAEAASDIVLNRKMDVRFDANTNSNLPWTFKPVQRKITLKIGETKLAFYRATNNSKETVTGTASFNVSPEIAGSYFNKIACFCFTEQTLKPGETVDMPVSFFIDPEIVKDPDAKVLSEITLSYTFYPSAKQKSAKAIKEKDRDAAKDAKKDKS